MSTRGLLDFPATSFAATGAPPPRQKVGPCDLGDACSAKDTELLPEYRCRHCNKQLHGFISGCSKAKNEKDFRDGVICKHQPCVVAAAPPAARASRREAPAPKAPKKKDGVAIAEAAGLPKFLWETQKSKRHRDPNAPKQRRQRYTKDQKQMILHDLLSNPSAKLPEVAKHHNIPEGTLRGWYDDDRRSKAAASAMEDIGAEISEHILDPPIEETPPVEDIHPRKRRRQRYSNETKIQVILALETRPNSSLNDVAKEFNVAAGTVRGWREEADKIQMQAMENRRVGAKANPSRDPLRRVWNSILAIFEKNSRLPQDQRLDLNVAVVKTIGTQARDALMEAHMKEPFLTESEVTAMNKFKASDTWARKWARDHEVLTAPKKEDSSSPEIAQAKFIALQNIVREFPPERVYSLTSTSLFFRILPHRTYVQKLGDGSRVRACKGLKCKDRLTFYLCTNENGTDKVPATCIGKYENPACFQVEAQKILPYLSQKQSMSDAGTFQQWWRTIFLPHIRSQLKENEKCLLLVEEEGPCTADLLKDPTGQVRVEALPPKPASTIIAPPKPSPADALSMLSQQNQANSLPQCQALELGILETIKRRYRYRLLQEVMEAFEEREMRRKVANEADFPIDSRGLREGTLASVGDAMRLIQTIWDDVTPITIARAWQRTKLRSRGVKEDTPSASTQRGKSEKRQLTREKKQLVKDLSDFLGKHESKDFHKEDGANRLEEMIEKLKNCFLYTDGEVIDAKEMFESLEEWIGLEDSQGMIALNLEEIKKEMNIDYLTGIKDAVEGVVPEAEDGEDPVLARPAQDDNNDDSSNEITAEAAVELAAAVKTTATKLLAQGNILGGLAVRLDEAADSILQLLRDQKAAANAKLNAEKAKLKFKEKAKARAEAAAAAPPTEGDLGNVLTGIEMAGV